MLNYKYDKEVFCRQLDKLMKKENCETAKEFSEKTGLSETIISKWRNGNASPGRDALFEICNRCDCDLDYLLGRIDTLHRENQSTHEETGLSEEAINTLRGHREKLTAFQKMKVDGKEPDLFIDKYKITLELISSLITSPEFQNVCDTIQWIKTIRAGNDDPQGKNPNEDPRIEAAREQLRDSDYFEYTIAKDLQGIVSKYIKTAIPANTDQRGE